LIYIFIIFEINLCIIDDELVEVTPKGIRIRKKELNPDIRKRMKRMNIRET